MAYSFPDPNNPRRRGLARAKYRQRKTEPFASFPDPNHPQVPGPLPKGPGPGQPAARGERRDTPPLRQRRRMALNRALRGLSEALMASGISQPESRQFARVLLSRPGIRITRGGRVNYRGDVWNASDFATSGLADWVTGRTAERRNRAAIEGDPGYMQSLAELELARDLGISGLDERRRRAVLDFGDPSFADDGLLGAQAGANPFSISRLLGQQFESEQSAMRQAAARAGTAYGGGFTSGMAGVGRANAARQTDATRSLQDLLAGLTEQASQARRGFDLGRTGALSEATQRLMSTGAIHAARPPNLRPRQFRFWRPRSVL